MLPPSMLRNLNQYSSGSLPVQNAQVGSSTVGQDFAATENSNNQNHLLQQLRSISSELGITQSRNSATAPTRTQRKADFRNSHQTVGGPSISITNNITCPDHTNATTVGVDDRSVVSNTSTSVMGNLSEEVLFPYILHRMLEDVERIGQTNIVSWNADGKSFRIHDPDTFVSLVLQKYLKKYVGGIASRLTQFRSELFDWGFEHRVGGQRSGETFTHFCFQKGQPNLCRYMRCGRRAEDACDEVQRPPISVINPPTQARIPQVHKSNGTGAIHISRHATVGNAAQILIQQAQAQASHRQQQKVLQQQQQQQQALQIQALLNGLTNGSNPVTNMILNQLAHQQKEQQRRQHQQQISSVIAAAATLQRQQQQQQKSFLSNSASAPTNVSSFQPLSTKLVPINKPTAVQTLPLMNIPASPSPGRLPSKQLSAHQQIKTDPTYPATARASAANKLPQSLPDVSAKRAAFLKKRSKATGAVYRNPNKKQKKTRLAGSGQSAVQKTNKSGAIINASGFKLHESFREKETTDLLFPWKLHDMLDHAENNQDLKSNVVAWQPDGVSFSIHSTDRFVKEVLPIYFEGIANDFDSFTEVLSQWGFVRFASGAQKGVFIHRLLLKGKRSICKQMRINGKTVSDWMKHHGQFIIRLHALICHVDREGSRDIVSWTPDGNSFTVHDPTAFMNTVYTMYFDSTTYGSFENKLRRWGFMRSPANHQKIGKEKKLENAVYSHPHFVRGTTPNLVWVKASKKIPRTLQQHNFLVRLRVMLSDASRHGNAFVVSWAPHGKAFMIHDRPHFSSNIMPSYFKSKFNSFRQSLRSHGFAQIAGNGWDEGAYYHKLFIRDQPQLCQGLTQEQMKEAMPEWIPVEKEPNFYPHEKNGQIQVPVQALRDKS